MLGSVQSGRKLIDYLVIFWGTLKTIFFLARWMGLEILVIQLPCRVKDNTALESKCQQCKV